VLSTPEAPAEDSRAWRLYRRLGFVDLLRQFHFPGDDRPFAVLGRPLPLDVPAARPGRPPG
jgi:ribosomal protein S18 acetylase RimI-like enzyme